MERADGKVEVPVGKGWGFSHAQRLNFSIDGSFRNCAEFRADVLSLQASQRIQVCRMDLWATLLIFAFMAGIMGWIITPFVNCVLWICDWQDGMDINWGMSTVLTIMVPFTWMFAIFEICVLYCK